jgi:hypothetical protein
MRFPSEANIAELRTFLITPIRFTTTPIRHGKLKSSTISSLIYFCERTLRFTGEAD